MIKNMIEKLTKKSERKMMKEEVERLIKDYEEQERKWKEARKKEQ